MSIKPWLWLGALVAFATYTGWLVSVGRSLERADQAAATAAANREIARQNAELAAARSAFQADVDRAVSAAVSGIVQGMPPPQPVMQPVPVLTAPPPARCERTLPVEVIRRINRIGGGN